MSKQHPNETPEQKRARLAAARVELADRKKRVFEARLGGMTYRQIAETVPGIPNPGNAHRLFTQQLATVPPEAVGDARQVELARYDEIQTKLVGRLRAGDLDVVDRLLRLSDRRVRLLGLLAVEPDAPHADLKQALGQFLVDAITKDEQRTLADAEAERLEALGPDAVDVSGLEST